MNGQRPVPQPPQVERERRRDSLGWRAGWRG